MTAMDTLYDGVLDVAGMPRFDDGIVNLSELIRVMAEALVY